MWFDTALWLVAVIAFVAVEAATTALVSVWFAIGAAAAMAASFFTGSFAVQLAVFAVISAAALCIMLPSLIKRRGGRQAPVTNGAPLSIGKVGVVLAEILPGEPGRVRVDGLDWQARAEQPLPQGAKCRVTDVDGAMLVVCPLTPDTGAD